MAKVNPDFLPELKKYGGVDFSACYNCGNCTAICSLSTPEDSFPRMMVRASVVGLEDKITGSLDPWLCYYCGDYGIAQVAYSKVRLDRFVRFVIQIPACYHLCFYCYSDRCNWRCSKFQF